MDLIYTDGNRVDKGVLHAYALDLSFGADENDFEMTLGADEPALEFGAFVYMEGAEYGGIVDARKTSTDDQTITYTGRTWHGVLNSKIIQPDSGADYYTVSGDANAILATLINRLGLSGLFAAAESTSGITVSSYQFNRYCAGYDGIRAMLDAVGAKLKIAWQGRAVRLSAEPITDYTDDPVDGDTASIIVEQHGKKVNHLICLGQGELAEREVIHLYVNASGAISETQYYTGLDEYAEVYDYSSVESSAELRSGGESRLKELRGSDTAAINLFETEQVYDVGDIVGATDIDTGVSVAAAVSQKIVRIENGAVNTEYKTGG